MSEAEKMPDDEIEIVLRHLSVVRIEPGDTLVLRTQHTITPAAAARMAEFAKNALPGVRVMVVGDGMELSVLRGLPDPTQP